MNTAKVKAQFAKIPHERLLAKIKRTIVGLLFVAFTGIAIWRNWPWYVAASALAVGAHIISGELVQGAAKFLIATLKDLVGAKK